jgi:uncharacterized integral membrane protein
MPTAAPAQVVNFPAVAGSPTSSHTPRHRIHIDRARLPRLIIAAVAAIYGIIFIALNRTHVKIHFLFFTVTSRLWVGFLVCLALGALLGQAFGAYRKRRSGRTDPPAGAGHAS